MLVKKQISPGLRLIAHECEAEGFKGWRYEHAFAPPRRFRFDLCFPDYLVAFEREGLGKKGTEGRHQRIAGFKSDIEKYNLAASLGWLVVRATADMIRDGSALSDLLAVLRYRQAARTPPPSR